MGTYANKIKETKIHGTNSINFIHSHASADVLCQVKRDSGSGGRCCGTSSPLNNYITEKIYKFITEFFY